MYRVQKCNLIKIQSNGPCLFFFKILLLAKLRAKNQSLSISGCGISNFQGKNNVKKNADS